MVLHALHLVTARNVSLARGPGRRARGIGVFGRLWVKTRAIGEDLKSPKAGRARRLTIEATMQL